MIAMHSNTYLGVKYAHILQTIIVAYANQSLLYLPIYLSLVARIATMSFSLQCVCITYTANVYRQTTDELMFKSVISTVR